MKGSKINNRDWEEQQQHIDKVKKSSHTSDSEIEDDDDEDSSYIQESDEDFWDPALNMSVV